MAKHHLRRFEVLAVIVVVGGLGGPEVVTLYRSTVFLEEASEPLEQRIAGSNSSIRGEYQSVMRRILLLPIGFHRIHHFWLHHLDSREGLLSFEPDNNAAVIVGGGLRDLIIRHAHNVLDATGTPVQ